MKVLRKASTAVIAAIMFISLLEGGEPKSSDEAKYLEIYADNPDYIYAPSGVEWKYDVRSRNGANLDKWIYYSPYNTQGQSNGDKRSGENFNSVSDSDKKYIPVVLPYAQAVIDTWVNYAAYTYVYCEIKTSKTGYDDHDYKTLIYLRPELDEFGQPVKDYIHVEGVDFK